MHWSYDELLDLPYAVYCVLVEELTREATELERDRPRDEDEVTH